MRSTFKVLFYVKKGSAKPNGNLPLMCRLTVDGEIKQFSCKMDVPPRLWDVKNSREMCIRDSNNILSYKPDRDDLPIEHHCHNKLDCVHL